MKKHASEGIQCSSVIQVGYGRLGLHLNRHLNAFFNAEVQLLKKGESLSKALLNKNIKYIFLAVPDSQIENCIQFIPERIKVIHFSGFYYSQKVLGIHPVQSFSKEGEYNFNDIDFVIDGELDDFLSNLFKKTFKISPEIKKAYHTYLSVVANSFQLLANQIGKKFSKETGLHEDIIKKITIQSLERERIFGSKSFSGPWVRNENERQNEQVRLMHDENLKELNDLFQNTIRRYKNEHT